MNLGHTEQKASVPHGGKKTSTRAEVSLNASRVDNQLSVEKQSHVFDSVSGRQVRAGVVYLEALPEVSALPNLEELSMKDFLAELKAGEIAEMVLLNILRRRALLSAQNASLIAPRTRL
ncbi:LOW QUALITY PROTEIN: Pol protein [Phytophthora palmivora]|uniref:Pol protein n=1 Tax=Phytophthora palmivora TaxID=4796 RepID=A0A2P4YGT9_9STRA|nr:LOW QUALITY PROTEIN: Pol protein [Phytophthora palmivora]